MRLNRHHRVGHCLSRRYSFVLLNVTILGFSGLCFLLNETLLKQWDQPFFHNYFNDLFAMPILCSVSNLWIQAWRHRKGWRITSPLRIGILTAFAAFTWECITPLYKKSAVFDPLDILMYGIGATAYGCIVNSNCCRHKANRT